MLVFSVPQLSSILDETPCWVPIVVSRRSWLFSSAASASGHITSGDIGLSRAHNLLDVSAEASDAGRGRSSRGPFLVSFVASSPSSSLLRIQVASAN